MVAQCPISGAKVGAVQSRLNGLFTVLALALFFARPHPAIPLLLAFDFLLRAFPLKWKSPIALASKSIVRRLRLAETMIDAAPKRFAARLGLGFSLAAAVLAFAHQTAAAIAVAGLFAACAGLEASIGFCVGCWIHSWLARFRREAETA